MALDGGGGGGGPVGSSNSFTGVSSSIELIGDHCYILPGLVVASTTIVTVAEFTSGNYYTVGRLYLNNGIPYNANIGDADMFAAYVFFNGTRVVLMSTGNAQVDSNTSTVNELIIPPYTEVKIEMVSDVIDNDAWGTLSYVGRIYRTRA